MENREKISSKVIGQIALMQSVITQLPDTTSVMDFVCKGFKDIPGINNVLYKLNDATSINEEVENSKNFICLIKYKNNYYGFMKIEIKSRVDFDKYLPYIKNFCSVLGVIFEEKNQRRLNTELLSTLEHRVEERTKELNLEINQRKKTERSLIQSEKKLSFALKTSHSGIWDWNIITNEVLFDTSYYTIAGYDPGDFPQNFNEWEKRAHPDDLNKIKTEIEKYLNNEIDEYRVEFRFLCKNGRWMWMLGQGKIFSYINGKPERFIGTNIDIDSQKTADKNLASANNYITNIINSMPSIIIGTTTNGLITQWNSEAERKTGITAQNAKGKLLEEIVPFLFLNSNNLKESLFNITEQVQFNSKRLYNNQTIHEEITIYPVTANGTQGVVIRVDDVTKKHNMEFQLRQSQKMDAIGQLTGGVAHDFNNSLTGIIGAADLILGGNCSIEKQKKYLNMILTSAERAGELTKKLLLFSRKGNKLSSPVDMLGIVNETMALLEHTIDKNISISIVNNSTNTRIIGDDSMLQNALMNLAINSSHAMLMGGEIVFTLENITLNSEYCKASPFKIEPGEYLEIDIRDTGTGMSPQIQSHIFEPFFTTKEQGKGTGIGLATVYGAINEHNGAINVYSEEGSGTVFHLFFPITTTKLINTKKRDKITGSGTILVIDDEELIRITSKAMLVSLGYNVLYAENGKIGVEMFSENSNDIDLIILDMIMPVMGGREALGYLREIDNNIPVIISSGFAKDSDLKLLQKHEITGFIHKPFRSNELAKCVAGVLGHTNND